MRKLTYALVFAILIMLSSSSTRAGAVPTDPRIGAGGGGSCFTIFQETSLLDTSVPTGCIVDFVNDTGAILFNWSVTVNTPFTGALSCIIDLTQNGFSPFSVATLTSPNTCTFSGGATGDAVGTGGTLGVQFGYTDAPFSTSSLDVSVTTTPEPASIALIGTGVAAVVARRKRLESKRLAS